MLTTDHSMTRLVVRLVALGFATGLAGLALALLSARIASDVLPAQAIRLAGLATVLAGAAVALAGLAIEVFSPVIAGRTASRAEVGSHRVILSSTALAVLLAVLLSNLVPLALFVGREQRDFQSLPGFLAAALSTSLALLGVAYFRFLRPGAISLQDLGFGPRYADPGMALLDLFIGLVAGLGILFLNALIGVTLRLGGVEQTQLREFLWVQRLPPDEFGVIFLVGAVLAPITEEIFFRGIVFGAYLRVKGPLVAYSASALVFAVLHFNLPALVPIVVLALGLAWLYRLTGSIVPSIVAHLVNNGIVFLALYLRLAERAVGGG